MLLFLCANLLLFTYYFPAVKQPKKGDVYDVAIVLGCPSKEDGCISRMQKSRIHAAIQLYEQHIVDTILISGGSVRNAYTEADIMAAYASTCGIPAHALLLERQAQNTFENLHYAKALCEQHHFTRVVVVTSCFHARRASFMVRKYFDDYAMQKTTEKEKCKHYILEYFRMWNTLYYEVKLRKKK